MSFVPLLDHIGVRLREILSTMLEEIESGQKERMVIIGARLLDLHRDIDIQLKELGHGVLSATLRDAGINIDQRARGRNAVYTASEDREYFLEVYSALKHINDKIETGEYYTELMKVRDRRYKLLA